LEIEHGKNKNKEEGLEERKTKEKIKKKGVRRIKCQVYLRNKLG
jgi:hypothetical protein